MSVNKPLLFLLFCSTLILTLPKDAIAATPPCSPCAGINVESPAAAIAALTAEPQLDGEERLYVAWTADLDGSADTGPLTEVSTAGGTPWAVLRFRSPAPILENVEALEAELEEVARLSAAAGERTHFQILWQPSTGEATTQDYAFLLKRAAVAVTGGRADARVIAHPPSSDREALTELYGEEIAAYADGIAFDPLARPELEAGLAALRELDPGKPAVLFSLGWPSDALLPVARAADYAQLGFGVTFFNFAGGPADLVPLKLLAREFQGDLSLDPYSTPTGVDKGWTFVRGSDLGLRVIAERGAAETFELTFSDSQLRTPTRVDLTTGQDETIYSQRRTTNGLAIEFENAPSVVLLRLERMTAAELEGVEEELTVADERQLPVEEILRRLQAFEDAQKRKLAHYQADNTMHLRFRLGNGVGSFEASYEGPFFYQRDKGFDWVWETFYVNGVKWKGDKLPEIPLIQPEKSVALPLEINFSKQYRYRLRGTAIEEGRDTWVVDFSPLEVTPGEPLYRGTVWIDREIYARVKTRALQVGLEGEVISNEETTFFSPIDSAGQPAAWDPASYFVPLRVVGQQLISLLNATIQVENETTLTNVRLNGSTFDSELQAAYASEATMVRDTDQGMRYLVRDKKTGERQVQAEIDTTRLFLLGGTFWDSTQDFPVPLVGFNYLALDFKGTGNQVNLFFGGALLTANIAQPRLFGSRWDAGANLFGFFVPIGDEQFVDGEEVEAEEVETRPLEVSVFLGRPLGNFFKLDFTYELEWETFDRADDTAEDFILPEDTFVHNFETELSYSRNGFRASAQATFSSRSDWEFWGLPGNTEFDPEQDEYVRWQIGLAKNWWLPNFFKVGAGIEHLNGSDLDRFSKYDFSFFSGARVRGYPSGLVRAEEASGVHLNGGFNLGEVIRFELNADAFWITDEVSGFDNELIAGVGLNGTTRGPWNTIVNFDVGVPVKGPADDPVLFLTFLKLFR